MTLEYVSEGLFPNLEVAFLRAAAEAFDGAATPWQVKTFGEKNFVQFWLRRDQVSEAMRIFDEIQAARMYAGLGYCGVPEWLPRAPAEQA